MNKTNHTKEQAQDPWEDIGCSRGCDIYHNINYLIKEFNNLSNIIQFEIE